ncbi:MAG TPA: methyltransferase domain-containing protein [Ktedonobacterales bacterium]|nr:methyltransferase domain-containing protein [Ktedonobacterales bacterium]
MGSFNWLRRKQKGDRVTPTIYIEGGRQRAAGVPYPFPRDVEEMNRLDFQHYLLRAALQGNFAAPITAPGSILDVGTGTGRWAREMAQLFPIAAVVGMDIVTPPIEDALADTLPGRYTFVPGNVLEGLAFDDASFDFTHMRFLISALPRDRWPFIMRELTRVTRPGGWVESVEPAPLAEAGPAVSQLMELADALFARRGIYMNPLERVDIGELMYANGLADVVTRVVNLPVGRYGERLGTLMATDTFAAYRSLGGLIAAQGFMTQEQFDALFAQAQAEIDSAGYRCVAPVYIAYGRRP